MTSYAALLDTARLLYAQKRDHITAYRAGAKKGDRLAQAHMQMDALHVSQLAALDHMGSCLAAVKAAHDRDPDELARVLQWAPPTSQTGAAS